MRPQIVVCDLKTDLTSHCSCLKSTSLTLRHTALISCNPVNTGFQDLLWGTGSLSSLKSSNQDFLFIEEKCGLPNSSAEQGAIEYWSHSACDLYWCQSWRVKQMHTDTHVAVCPASPLLIPGGCFTTRVITLFIKTHTHTIHHPLASI